MAAVLQRESVLHDLQEALQNGSYNTKMPESIPGKTQPFLISEKTEILQTPTAIDIPPCLFAFGNAA